MYRIVVLGLLICNSINMFGQNWYGAVLKDSANLHEVEFNFNQREVSKIKGKEKEFIKWARSMADHLDANGNIVNNQKQYERLRVIQSEKEQVDISPNWQAFNRNTIASKPQLPRNKGLVRGNRVYVAPYDSKVIYGATAYAGLWRSTDEGRNWEDLTRNKIPVTKVWSVGIHPTDPNILLLGDQYTMYRSDDGGETWTRAIEHTGLVRDVFFNEAAPDTVYAACQSGFYRSENGGESWQLKKQVCINAMQIHPTNPNVIYFTEIKKGDAIVHRSEDGGNTFEQINLPVSTSRSVGRVRMAVSSAVPDNVYLVTNNMKDHGMGALYVSTNQGKSFQIIGENEQDGGPYSKEKPNVLGYDKEGIKAGGQLNFCFAFTVSDTNPLEMYIAGICMWKSKDGGLTWKNHTSWYETKENLDFYLHADIHDIVAFKNKVWVVHDGGFSFSNDKTSTFDLRSDGINGLEILGLATCFQNSDVLACACMHVGSMVQSSDVYDGWLPLNGGDDNYVGMGYAYDNIVFHGSGYVCNRALLPQISVKPQNFVPLPKKEPSGELGLHTRNHHVLFQSLTNYEGGAETKGSKLYKSEDYGKSWHLVFDCKDHSDDGRGVNARIYSAKSKIEVAWNNPELVYYKNGSCIYNSSDGGESWKKVYDFVADGDKRFRNNRGFKSRVLDMLVDPCNDSTLYVSFRPFMEDYVIMRSTDGGKNWSDFSQGIPKAAGRVNSLVMHRGTDGGMYAGTYRGVYYRDNKLQQWIPYHNGLPICDVVKVIIDYNKQQLVAGTFGRGIWKADLYEKTRPHVRIAYNKKRIGINEMVHFVDYSALNGKSVKYKWEFEGGYPRQSKEKNPKVIYRKPGTYDVTLKLETESGDTYTETLQKEIIVGYPFTQPNVYLKQVETPNHSFLMFEVYFDQKVKDFDQNCIKLQDFIAGKRNKQGKSKVVKVEEMERGLRYQLTVKPDTLSEVVRLTVPNDMVVGVNCLKNKGADPLNVGCYD